MHPTEPKSAPEPPSILTKAFEVLYAFSPDHRVMTLSELARAAQLPKSTMHRLLARLFELDAIERHGDGYKLSLSLTRLGSLSPAASMRDTALPFLLRLYQWGGHTVSLGVLRGFDVVFLEHLGNMPVAGHGRVGTAVPASCTATGKALLAWEDPDDLADFLPSPLPALTQWSVRDVDRLISELRVVHARGLADERNEHAPGMAGLGAPLVVGGYAVGAIAISYPTTVALPSQVEGALRTTALNLSRAIQHGLREAGHERFGPEVFKRPMERRSAHGSSAAVT